MAGLLVGTAQGLHEIGGEGAVHLPGQEITALARDGQAWWAVVAGEAVWRNQGDGTWDQQAVAGDQRLACISSGPAGVLVGTAEAHLGRVAQGIVERIEPFDRIPGREEWYTPWGGPPDVRSIAQGESVVLVNVHVGGIPVSADEGRTWRPTIDIHSDVHEVKYEPRSGLAVAACARGLAVSLDDGVSWDIRSQGLHSTYCRAVAVSGGHVLVSASRGPRGGQAALYRQPLDGNGPLERCTDGLPQWFDGNIDTGCVDGRGEAAAFGTGSGEVFVSEDAGSTWTRAADGLPAISCLGLT
jgi:hypothetical protein